MIKLGQNPLPSQAIIFLHIPKTAGGTLNSIIKRQYKKSEIFTVDKSNINKFSNEFEDFAEAKKNTIKIFKGHLYFGLHQHISQPCTYITILRDPVDRVISHYYYVLRTVTHYLHNEVVSRSITLEDYVRSKISPELDNGQTRLLSGLEGVKVGECSSEMLEIAKRNMQESFSVIGISEKFDETLMLMTRKFGWKMPFYVKLNVTQNRPLKESLPKDILLLIKEYNKFDVELYELAKQSLTESIVSYGNEFQAELKLFKSLNELYNGVNQFMTFFRKLVRF